MTDERNSSYERILASLPSVTAEPWEQPELYYRQRKARFDAAKAAGLNTVILLSGLPSKLEEQLDLWSDESASTDRETFDEGDAKQNLR